MFKVDDGALVGDNERIAVEIELEAGGTPKLRNVLTGHVMVSRRPPLNGGCRLKGEQVVTIRYRLASIKTRDPLRTSFEFSI